MFFYFSFTGNTILNKIVQKLTKAFSTSFSLILFLMLKSSMKLQDSELTQSALSWSKTARAAGVQRGRDSEIQRKLRKIIFQQVIRRGEKIFSRV